MKKWILFFIAAALVLSCPLTALADDVMDEIRALKGRIEQLEKKLAAQDTKIDKQEQVIAEHESTFEELGDIKSVISGLEISVGATSVVQGTIGNDDNIGHDDTDATYSVDIEITSAIGEHGTALLYLEGGEGNGIYDEMFGFNGYNADAPGDDADLQISEIWYEHSFADDMVVATIGKMDVTRWFDGNAVASDECSQFLADVFVNNIAVEFPDYAYGARVTISPAEMFDIGLVAVDADSDFEDIADENFLMAEIGLKPKFGELQGNYRVYGWHNSGNKVEFDDLDDMREDGYGIGLSLDQQITDAVTAFARYGWQDDDIYAIEQAWSVGFQVAGSLWGRDDDMFGMAYGQSHTGDDYRDSVRAVRSWLGRRIGALGTEPSERTFEAYYRFQLNDHIAISPDIQVATDMLGLENVDTVTLLGIRAQLDF